MKKVFVLLTSLIMAVLLAGCGARLESTAEVNFNGKGQRIFLVEMKKSELKMRGKNSINEIDKLIKDACPDCIEYSYTEDKQKYMAYFVMPFNSIEDYEQKLDTFCKKKSDIRLDISDSPFSQKVLYSENISSKDMLAWLADALVDGGIVWEKDRNSIFESVETKLVLNGKQYDVNSSRIYVEEQLYCLIDSIDIYTVPSDEGKFTRVIKLNITENELKKNEQAISAYLEEAIPDGGTGVWENGEEGMKTFSVSLSGLNPAEMTEAMKKYTKYDICSFTEEDSPEAGGVFCKDAAFAEELNFKNYGCNRDGTVRVRYLFDEKLTEGTITNERKGMPIKAEESVTIGDNTYLIYDLGLTDNTRIKADLVRYYHFEEIDYTLDARGPGEIRREIVFHFDDNGTDEIGDVYDRIRALAATDETVSKVKVSLDANKLSLVFEGSAADINHMTFAVTGKDNNGISYAYEKKWMAPTTKCIVMDNLDLEGFVYQDPEDSEYWQIPVNYKAKVYGSGKKMLSSQSQIKKKGASFAGTIPSNGRMKLIYQTNLMNKSAFLWYLLIFVALAGCVGGVYFRFTAAREEKKELARNFAANEKASETKAISGGASASIASSKEMAEKEASDGQEEKEDTSEMKQEDTPKDEETVEKEADDKADEDVKEDKEEKQEEEDSAKEPAKEEPAETGAENPEGEDEENKEANE